MSSQIELRAEIDAELVDLLEGHFYETESAHWGIMQKEVGDPYEVFGIFPDRETAGKALIELRSFFPELPEDFAETVIEDADWQNAYKAFVKPWSDRKLHWIPLWERDSIQPPEGAAHVYLDAGMAFGTGTHETTRLCARRLLDYKEARSGGLGILEIIDAGCGSGVLALSASALGFRKIYGFDFDPEAITVCESNSLENAHIPKVEFVVGDLDSGLANRTADLILANIQTDVLIPNSDQLIHSLNTFGTLALSGILTKELAQVRDHFVARFANLRSENILIDSREDGEWADLLFVLG